MSALRRFTLGYIAPEGAALAVLQERTTRSVGAGLALTLRPDPYAQAIVKLARDLRIRTMTTDNGVENKQHELITKRTGAPVFFTDPYSSWQKGGIENADKMLRRCFPQGTDFSTVSQAEIDEVVTCINNSRGSASALKVRYNLQ